MNIDLRELSEFLVEAKKNTYASEGEGGERILEDGTKELTFEQGDWRYRDRYDGLRAFSGREVVFFQGKPVWSMVYFGRVDDGVTDVRPIYSLLKQALMQVEINEPFRGPTFFGYGGLTYQNAVSMHDVMKFDGWEEIVDDDQNVLFSLDYRGGGLRGEE